MNRLLSIAMLLLVAISASATDSNLRSSEQITLATTGRIEKIDFKNRVIKVRGSDNDLVRNVPDIRQSLRPKIGFSFPGHIIIALPTIRTGKTPSAKPADQQNNLDEYTVVVTKDTVIEDGGDAIRLEDFKAGETISIHGVLSGTTITASRVAKWS